jgi:hypothetical protein
LQQRKENTAVKFSIPVKNINVERKTTQARRDQDYMVPG